ncbi:hypothetical protein MUK42_18697 [Musa troglodytarum]|uniref:GPN-loop GTPase n=1 Tax=Musa troglodytarum TaxID=320322 RepID=A0A9E7ET80_9LILI|nr:hypothetical protein MUK42_18697 [Musa troglodytarum]
MKAIDSLLEHISVVMDVDSDSNSSWQMQMDSEDPTADESNSKGKAKDDLSELIENLKLSDSSSVSFKSKPVVIIVVGMAGILVCHTQSSNVRGYVLNLDPAVMTLPFAANIDIRDTVHYKEVMKEYNLGPNGGILTSLNLFATKTDEVISAIERWADQLDYVLVDTPGQIEIFTWSASGAIITEAFSSTFPTIIAYVVDTPRAANPVTFMSNMLYACSILYKTRLPLVLTFNKVDVTRHEFALEWMQDFEAFQAALDTYSSYTSTLLRSLSSFWCWNGSLFWCSRSKCKRVYGELQVITNPGSILLLKLTLKADVDKRRAEMERLEARSQER